MKNNDITSLILNVIGFAMGIAVVVLNVLNQVDEKSSLIMLGIGLFCIGLACLSNLKENKK